MKEYFRRVADDILAFKLECKGAVLIQGPKWCGKSTTAAQHAGSIVYMQDTTTKQQNISLAKADPRYFLKGATPKLIDEWQTIAFIWDDIRFEVDRRDEFGQFILTGSVTPANLPEDAHSGVGRITKMTMRTMSLYESLDSTGEVSLGDLFNGVASIAGKNDKTLYDLAFILCRGGWPKAIKASPRVALQQAIDYYEGLLDTDFVQVDGVKRDKKRLELLLRSYSRHISTQAANTTIKADMQINDVSTLDESTIVSYIRALEKLFVVEELPAWNPNLRSKAAIRTSDTRHFVDPSIATAALSIGPDDLMNDLESFGLLFESMCIRDLRVYAEKLNGTVSHYRDSNGLEVDAVIYLRGGKYGLAEIKLFSQSNIDEEAKNLLTLSRNIDDTKMQKPSFLMVLTGTQTAYRRDDGVYVVPVACLKD